MDCAHVLLEKLFWNLHTELDVTRVCVVYHPISSFLAVVILPIPLHARLSIPQRASIVVLVSSP